MNSLNLSLKNSMKIHILYQFRETAWGGGNQFLKALRNKFIEIGVYEELAVNADVILFNSHHEIFNIFKLKLKYPNKIFIHRIDGPVSAIRGSKKHIDDLIYKFNDAVADGTIFQSIWSKKENKKLGLNSYNNRVILNAPSPNIFNKKEKNTIDKNNKIKIIATSWSPNKRKGFDIYLYLDKYLNFSKYEMTFVGNSPYEFKNIKIMNPLPSNKLAEVIKKHDIFITASQKDTCSNSLIEALHCGLPAVVLNDGGHPEIVGKGGKTFYGEVDILEKIDNVAKNHALYQSKINLPLLSDVASQYANFSLKIFNDVYNQKYIVKKVQIKDFIYLFTYFYIWKIYLKISNIL